MRDNEKISFQLRTASNLIRRKMDSYMQAENYERLTGMQGYIIGYLYFNSGKDIFQKDIESLLSVRGSTVSAMLKLMEKNGHINRLPVPNDARLKRITLTENAVTRHEYFEKCIEHIEKTMTNGLSNDDIEQFNKTIEIIEKNLEKSE